MSAVAGPSGVARSEASAASASDSGDAQPQNIDKNVSKLCALLSSTPMTSKAHLTASKILVRLQDQLHSLSSGTAVKLSILCMSMGRKLLRMRETDEQADVNAFEGTFTLVFMLVAGIQARASGEVGSYDANELDRREKTLRELQSHSLWQQICRPSSRKRAREAENVDDEGFSDTHSTMSMSSIKSKAAGKQKENTTGNYNFSSQKDVDDLNSTMERERQEAETLVMRPFLTDSSSSRWSDVLYNGRELASTIVSVASCKLQSICELKDMKQLAFEYARSMLNQSRSTLLTTNRTNFMSLKVSSIMMLGSEGVADAVGSLVASAESESCQVVYRDILLSFLLPREFVGVRRTLLLPREVSAAATKEFSTYVSLAHESAICGVVDAFESNCELKRCCAILSALAMLTTGADIRHDVAFAGRVFLPFLEVPEPSKKGCLQLFLDVTQRQWTVFSTAGGKPNIELSGPGVCTLETALVLLADDK